MKLARLLVVLFVVSAAATHAQPSDAKYQHYQRLLQLPDDSSKCTQLVNYAVKMADSLRDYDFALLIFKKTNTLLKQHYNPNTELNLYYQWALTHFQKGEYEQADKLYTALLDMKLINTRPALKAKALNAAAANAQDLVQYTRALRYYNDALELYTKMDDAPGLGAVYQNMANVFALTGSYGQSNQFFDKAAELFKANNLMEKYAVVMGNRSYVTWRLGKTDSAKVLLIRALALPLKKMKNPGSLAERTFNLGLIYGELKKWDSCFYFLERGKQLSDSVGMAARFDATYYNSMAYSYSQLGQTGKAIAYYKQAIALRNGISNIRHLYDQVADLYLAQKKYDSAFLYKNISLKMADSVYKNEMEEHVKFENKRLALIERDHENEVQWVEQQHSLHLLSRRNYILLSIIVVLVAVVIVLFLYFRQYQLKKKKEHLQGELDFLRAQLNPHFLFNSINNIYVLLGENRDKASEILLKFSDLMRYQLYDCNVDVILLSKELQFLENYMEFEKLRYANKISVQYNFDTVPADNLYIAPLLLQPFIENAFKHSPKHKNKPGWILVDLSFKDNRLLFEVNNSYEPGETSGLPGGIGLENVRKRLHLLYPKKHHLKIERGETFYKINLTIDLNRD